MQQWSASNFIKWRCLLTPWRNCVTSSGVEGDANARSGANGDSNARPGANGNARGFRTSMATWLNDPALRYRLFYMVGDAIGSQADLAPRQRNRGLGRFRRIFHSVQSPGRHVFLLMAKTLHWYKKSCITATSEQNATKLKSRCFGSYL